MKKLWIKTGLITQLALLIVIAQYSLSAQPTNTILRISIMGAQRSEFIPGPCPPGEQCTYDSQGAYGVIFRLTYKGELRCNITKIYAWQKIFGSYFAGPVAVTPPKFEIPPEQSYEFKVEETFVMGREIGIDVQTREDGDVNLTITLTTPISWIPNWIAPPQPTEDGLTNVTLAPISAGIFITVLFTRRRKKREIRRQDLLNKEQLRR